MGKGRNTSVAIAVWMLAAFLAAPGFSQEAEAPPPPPKGEVPEAASLAELLKLVKQGYSVERKENQEREKRFAANKADQQRLLAQAEATLTALERQSEELESTFQVNEVTLAELEETLSNRLGSLGELFGVVRQVAGDARGNVENSIVSAQLRDDRAEFLGETGKSKELPEIARLERLWYELQREMTEQGKVVKFTAPLLTVDGQEIESEITRAGVFAATANGAYVLWDPEIGKLRELVRQPPAKYLNTVADFEATTSGIGQLAVDPSRGSLLSLLVDTPSWGERVEQGGAVGTVIIVLGIFAVIIGIWRYAVLFVNGRKVSAQVKSTQANDGNPLGRVLGVYEANSAADAETLELKLDEAVMRETAFLERFIWLIKVISVVAPLLGLLGTVTGMIQTFQAITLFGAGDPKMMAGGISEALVTTMLGLMTAIPLTLLHAFVASSAKRIVDTLDEQSAGLIAERSEQAGA